MKKLIITTVALAALTFVACKKDNLQPTTNSATNIEQVNNETTTDDDKAVDVRNKFVGTWTGTSVTFSGSVPYTLVISKSTLSRLKIVEYSGSGATAYHNTFFVKVTNSNKLKFYGKKSYTTNNAAYDYTEIFGSKTSTNSKKMTYITNSYYDGYNLHKVNIVCTKN